MKVLYSPNSMSFTIHFVIILLVFIRFTQEIFIRKMFKNDGARNFPVGTTCVYNADVHNVVFFSRQSLNSILAAMFEIQVNHSY